MDPNELIDTIVDAIDYAEIAHDFLGLLSLVCKQEEIYHELEELIVFHSQEKDRFSLSQHGNHL